MSYFRAENLSLHFGGLKAVDAVSFAVEVTVNDPVPAPVESAPIERKPCVPGTLATGFALLPVADRIHSAVSALMPGEPDIAVVTRTYLRG